MKVVQMLLAGVNSAAFCLLFGVPASEIVWAGFGGLLGYGITLLLPVNSTFLLMMAAGAGITLYAEGMARYRKAPVFLYLVPGLLPIVPGGVLFRALFGLLQRHWQSATEYGYSAFLQTGALMLGIVLTSFVASLVKKQKKLGQQANVPKP